MVSPAPPKGAPEFPLPRPSVPCQAGPASCSHGGGPGRWLVAGLSGGGVGWGTGEVHSCHEGTALQLTPYVTHSRCVRVEGGNRSNRRPAEEAGNRPSHAIPGPMPRPDRPEGGGGRQDSQQQQQQRKRWLPPSPQQYYVQTLSVGPG